MPFESNPSNKQATGGVDVLINDTDDILEHRGFKITPEVFYPSDKFQYSVQEWYEQLSEFRGYEFNEINYSNLKPSDLVIGKPKDYLDNLVARYKLDGDLLDSSGNGNNGTINYSANFVSWWKFEDDLVDEIGTQNLSLIAGTTTFVDTPFGRALDLNGSTYYHASDTPYDREHTDTFSIELWMKTTTSGTAVSKRAAGDGYYVDILSNKARFIIFFSGSAAGITSSTSVDDGKWHHIVATFSGNSNRSGMKIYVDGVLETTGTSLSISATILNNENFTTGAFSNGNTKFTGQLNHVRFYKSELTAEQVKELYRKNTKTNFDNGLGTEAFHPIDHEYATLGDTPFDFERTDKFSFTFWIRTDDSPDSDYWLNKGGFANGSWAIYNESGNDFVIMTLRGTTGGEILQVNATSGSVVDGQWHFVAVTYDGSSSASGLNIYVDGVLVSMSTSSDNLASSILNNNQLSLGAIHNGTQLTTGQFQDVRIYDIELSSDRQNQIYNATKAFYDPILWMKLDGNLNDSSSLGNDFTLGAGTELYDLPQVGTKSGRFNGATYHKFAEPNNQKYRFHENQPFSISFWLKKDATIPTTSEVYLSKQNGFAGGDRGFLFWTWSGSSGNILFRLDQGTDTEIVGSVLSADTWYHIVGTYDGSSNRSGMKIYIDGVLDVTGTSQAITSSILNNVPLTIGAFSSGLNDFTGQLDELKIWNYALTDDEILHEAGRKNGSIYIPMAQGKRYKVVLQDLSPTPRKYYLEHYTVS